MASSGMGVWVTLQSSSAVRLFHATRYECLADVDVAPPVHKMLQGNYGLYCRYAMRPESLIVGAREPLKIVLPNLYPKSNSALGEQR